MAPSMYDAPPDRSPASSPDGCPIESLQEFAEDQVGCLTRVYKRHGELVALQEGAQRIVFAFGPKYNQQLLTNTGIFHVRFFTYPGPKRSAQRRMGSGLLTMNGETHKQQRRLVMEPLQKKSLEAYDELLAATATEFLDGWRPGETYDMSAEMSHFILRMTSRVLFGVDQPEASVALGKMIEEWLKWNNSLGLSGLVTVNAESASYQGLLAYAESLEAKIRELIQVRRRETVRAKDILSILIRAHDEESGAQMTDEELIGQATLFFAAAHETMASTLTWTLFLLAQHPEVMRDLYDELDAQLRGGIPRHDQLERLPLLERVIKESMRILPAPVYTTRRNSEAVNLGPLHVPTGSIIGFSHYVTHHMPELFPKPEHFLPDRWLTATPSPYAYLPFGAGPRMCIGAPFAMRCLKISIASIVQRYRLSMVPGATVDRKVTVTLAPKDSLPMLVSRQDGEVVHTEVRGNIHEMVDLRHNSTAGAARRHS